MLKERERPLSTPLGTTSTDAMDTEEAQEFSKEIAEKVIERELKKQKHEQYNKSNEPPIIKFRNQSLFLCLI